MVMAGVRTRLRKAAGKSVLCLLKLCQNLHTWNYTKNAHPTLYQYLKPFFLGGGGGGGQTSKSIFEPFFFLVCTHMASSEWESTRNCRPWNLCEIVIFEIGETFVKFVIFLICNFVIFAIKFCEMVRGTS